MVGWPARKRSKLRSQGEIAPCKVNDLSLNVLPHDECDAKMFEVILCQLFGIRKIRRCKLGRMAKIFPSPEANSRHVEGEWRNISTGSTCSSRIWEVRRGVFKIASKRFRKWPRDVMRIMLHKIRLASLLNSRFACARHWRDVLSDSKRTTSMTSNGNSRVNAVIGYIRGKCWNRNSVCMDKYDRLWTLCSSLSKAVEHYTELYILVAVRRYMMP